MYSSCVMNTSKAVTAFSDFPISKDYPNYMHHSLYKKYLHSYAHNFNLLPHVQLQKEVIRVHMDGANGSSLMPKWAITTRDVQSGSDETAIFDYVMVCSGTYIRGVVPEFPDMDQFEGHIMHSGEYVDFQGFENKRVLVVGCGNSGAEIGSELSRHAAKVFIATRRGTVVFPRASHFGLPIDNILNTRFFQCLPDFLAMPLKKFIVNLRYQLSTYDLSPSIRHYEHSLNTINDDLCNRILVGAVTMKCNVERFHRRGVTFEDGSTEEIDTVVMATGYKVSFPFLDTSVVQVNNRWIPGLYSQIWFPHGPHSLAFIGQSFRIFLGTRMPIFEMQARWVSRVFAGRCTLPEVTDMLAAIERSSHTVRGENLESPRKVKHITYIDEIANYVGCRPRMLKYFFTDPCLWYKLMFWPATPAQWRLDGPGAWIGAKETVKNLQEERRKTMLTRHMDNNADGDWFDGEGKSV